MYMYEFQLKNQIKGEVTSQCMRLELMDFNIFPETLMLINYQFQ